MCTITHLQAERGTWYWAAHLRRRGKFFRPINKPISIRMDADVLFCFKARGGTYQGRMPEALRQHMQQRRKGGGDRSGTGVRSEHGQIAVMPSGRAFVLESTEEQEWPASQTSS